MELGVERLDEGGDTFNDMLSIHLDQPISSLSISPANRDVALGARKGLYIVDLNNPYETPRFLPHYSPWEVADVQWCPWSVRSEWVVSTSNQKAIVYNLKMSSDNPIEHTLHAHTRAITDINFASSDPYTLATCGLDGWVWKWDLRTGHNGGKRPVWGVCDWGHSATQVKWNRVEPHIVASAHDNRVLIWDDRFGSLPVKHITAHSAKIYGIDWSRRKADALITCSLDKSFKYWTMNDISSPLLTVNTSSPVHRCRYLPFGRGVLVLPQRSDHALSIWGRTKIERGNTAQPVARFEGSRDGFTEFVWRTRGGSDLDHDDRAFQLVTWSKDRKLRLWPISDEILKEVGHERGGKITVKMTRRDSPDISYRTFAETAARPLPLQFGVVPPSPLSASRPNILPTLPSSPLAPPAPPRNSVLTAIISGSPARPSLLTSSLLTAGFATPFASPGIATLPPKRSGRAMMTTTRVGNRNQRANDRLAWMEGVKVIKPNHELGENTNQEGKMVTLGMKENEGTVSSSMDATRDASVEVREMGMESRSSSVPRGTDAGTAREGGQTETAGSVSKATGTVRDRDGGSYVNLGEELTSIVRRMSRITFEKVHVAGRSCTVSLYSPIFLRATFTFPKGYPHAAPPAIDLERNADTSLKARALLLQGIRKLLASRAERGLPSFELALRFLLGDRRDLGDERKDAIELDEEDEEDELGVEVGTGISYNVPAPRRGGAVFGPSGQLVVFFPTDLFAAPVSKEPDTVASPTTSHRFFPPRLTDSFGSLAFGHWATHDDYAETDEALQCATVMPPRLPPIARRGSDPTLLESPPPNSSTIHIKDVSHLTLLDTNRTMCSLRGPPLDAAGDATREAILVGDAFLARIWGTLATLFAAESEGNSMMETLSAESSLQEIFAFLTKAGDLQLLGVIACLLEAHRRTVAVERPTMSREHSTATDYFNHRSPRGPSPLDTPLASGYRPTRYSEDRANSPRPSWTNLTAFFNHSVLSLRSSGSTPASPDQPFFPSNPPPTTRVSQYAVQLSPPATTRFSDAPGTRGSPRRGESRSPDGRAPDGRSYSEGRIKVSPSVTFGMVGGKPRSQSIIPKEPSGKRRVSIKLVDPHDRPVAWWLSSAVQVELEAIRINYAELLFRWGKTLDRVEVVKLFRMARVRHPNAFALSIVQPGTDSHGLVMARNCPNCSLELLPPLYTTCRTCARTHQNAKCSLCRLPADHLIQSCSVCFHAGHSSCLTKWFEQFDFCPSGCGHSCRESGGMSGMFLVPLPIDA